MLVKDKHTHTVYAQQSYLHGSNEELEKARNVLGEYPKCASCNSNNIFYRYFNTTKVGLVFPCGVSMLQLQ